MTPIPSPDTAPPALFSAVDADGDLVALRRPAPGEVLCADCLGALLAGGDAGHRGPGSLHDCTDTFLEPVWLRTEPGCTADARTHLTEGRDCSCGLISLYEALESLDETGRQAAVDAHLDAIRGLYDHLGAAEDLTGQLGDDAGGAYLPAACLQCLTDPQPHLSEIEGELTARSLELVTVLRAWDITMHVGALLPPGPIGARSR